MRAAGGVSVNAEVTDLFYVAIACAEIRDIPCTNAAVDQVSKLAAAEPDRISQDDLAGIVLYVTAALLNHGETAAAEHWLSVVERQHGNQYKNESRPKAQLQRSVILAQAGRFKEARRLALEIAPGRGNQEVRGEALRIAALLEAQKSGKDVALASASQLNDNSDRAYALLGVSQALLGIGDLNLPYRPPIRLD
jgi:hypothetical protein